MTVLRPLGGGRRWKAPGTNLSESPCPPESSMMTAAGSCLFHLRLLLFLWLSLGLPLAEQGFHFLSGLSVQSASIIWRKPFVLDHV